MNDNYLYEQELEVLEEKEAEIQYYNDTMESFYEVNWNSDYSEISGNWYGIEKP